MTYWRVVVISRVIWQIALSAELRASHLQSGGTHTHFIRRESRDVPWAKGSGLSRPERDKLKGLLKPSNTRAIGFKVRGNCR
ncbi:hypothetical protein V8E53_003675 [Lactarius tabidus]